MVRCACYCGKNAMRRISTTNRNPQRPFFNCYMGIWDKQCGFFKWEDVLYSDEDECFECLKLKRKIDEIESARDTRDRENLELLAKLEAAVSELNHVKKKAKLANEAEDDQYLPFQKLSNSSVKFEFGEIGKKSKLANEADGDELLQSVKLSNSNDGAVESDMGQTGKTSYSRPKRAHSRGALHSLKLPLRVHERKRRNKKQQRNRREVRKGLEE